MKKYLSYSIISIILVSLLSLILFLQIPRLSYKYSEEHEGYLITNVYGNVKEYSIPSTYKDKKVVGIARQAFYKQTRLERINFSNDSNIKIIDINAFHMCTNLKEITIPKSVEVIGNNAFLGCSNLNKVSFEENSSLTSIEGSAFFDCTNLNYVYLPTDIRYSIGDYCFHNTNILELVLNRKTKLYPNALDGVKVENIIYE